MKVVKSCGFIAYTEQNGEKRYLLIKSTNGDVGFPKGHVEAGESERETALAAMKQRQDEYKASKGQGQIVAPAAGGFNF